MKKNEYTINNVTYAFDRTLRKWKFTQGSYTFIQTCPGGKATADLVAKQVSIGVTRTKGKGLCNATRTVINTKILVPVVAE